MYNKSWLDINKTRSYPFRSCLPVIDNNWIIDMTIAVHNAIVLPLHVSKITISSGGFSLLVLDKNNQFIGVFVYTGSTPIKLSPTSNGCTGSLSVDSKIIDNDIINRVAQVIETHIEIELKVISFYKKAKIKNLIIKRLREEDSIINKDIIFEENDFLELLVNKYVQQDIVTINCKQSFYPKCEQKTPIQQINTVSPNSNGDLYITIAHDGITTRKIDQDILEIGSTIDITDFNKYALTGPRGETGNPGPRGVRGPQGGLVCEDNLIDDYGGMRYDGICLYAIYLPTSSAVLVGGDSKPFILDTEPLTIKEFGNCQSTIAISSGFIIACSTGIFQVDLKGKYVKNIEVPHSGNVYLCKYSNSSDYFFIATDSDVYMHTINNLLLLYHSQEPIRNISYVNNKVYIFFDNGIMKSCTPINPPNLVHYDFFTTETLRGMYDKWIITDSGKLIKFTGHGASSTVIELSANSNFRAIDGIHPNYIIAVGDYGLMYLYTGRYWEMIGSPPIKSWKSVFVISESESYIFS